eukprot:g2537.t1
MEFITLYVLGAGIQAAELGTYSEKERAFKGGHHDLERLPGPAFQLFAWLLKNDPRALAVSLLISSASAFFANDDGWKSRYIELYGSIFDDSGQPRSVSAGPDPNPHAQKVKEILESKDFMNIESKTIRVVVIGCGCTGRNGNGLHEVFQLVNELDWQVTTIIRVDPEEIGSTQRAWLYGQLVPQLEEDKRPEIECVKKTAADYLGNDCKATELDVHEQTKQQFIESINWTAMQQGDRDNMSRKLVTQLVSNNPGLQPDPRMILRKRKGDGSSSSSSQNNKKR